MRRAEKALLSLLDTLRLRLEKEPLDLHRLIPMAALIAEANQHRQQIGLLAAELAAARDRIDSLEHLQRDGVWIAGKLAHKFGRTPARKNPVRTGKKRRRGK